MPKVHWKNEPEDKDYAAASAYLSLLAEDELVERIVAMLRAAPLRTAKAKDIIRASRLALLPVDDPLVARDLTRARDGKALSPVLLVRGEVAREVALQIADGYHRVCANYHLGDDNPVPYRMAILNREW